MKYIKYLLSSAILFALGWYVGAVVDGDKLKNSPLTETEEASNKLVVPDKDIVPSNNILDTNESQNCPECELNSSNINIDFKESLANEEDELTFEPAVESEPSPLQPEDQDYSVQLEDFKLDEQNLRIQEKLLDEPVDYEWAESKQSDVRELFDNNTGFMEALSKENLMFEGVECKTTVCKISLLSTSHVGKEKMMREMMLVGGTLSQLDEFKNMSLLMNQNESGQLFFYLENKE